MLDSASSKKDSLEKLLYNVSAPIASALQVSVWGIRVLRARGVTIQVFIDTMEPLETSAKEADETLSLTEGAGVTVETCALFSRILSTELDMLEAGEDEQGRVLQKLSSYTLEVSTPGIERQFFQCMQLEPYKGETLQVQLQEPLTKESTQRKYKGVLESVKEKEFVLVVEEQSLCIPWGNVARVTNVAQYKER